MGATLTLTGQELADYVRFKNGDYQIVPKGSRVFPKDSRVVCDSLVLYGSSYQDAWLKILMNAVKYGHKLSAIKAVRVLRGSGLKESKDLVDAATEGPDYSNAGYYAEPK